MKRVKKMTVLIDGYKNHIDDKYGRGDMDIGRIGATSVQHEPPQPPIFGMNEARLTSFENQDSTIKKKDVSISKKEAQAVVESLEEYMNVLKTTIGFNINDSTNEIVVTVTNKDSGEIIRHIPSEEILELHEKMKDLTGLIFSQSV